MAKVAAIAVVKTTEDNHRQRKPSPGYPKRDRFKYLCRGCDTDFASLTAFDRHRTGTFDYDYEKGVLMDPPRYDGRRCRSYDEMESKKMELDKNGSWCIPPSENAREFFKKVRTL